MNEEKMTIEDIKRLKKAFANLDLDYYDKEKCSK